MAYHETITLDVLVSTDDYERAREKAISDGISADHIQVEAEVSLDDALEEATVDQLREALGREEPGYTPDQLIAIEACFAAVVSGDLTGASAFLSRIFDHAAQIDAAERAIHANHFRSVANA